MSFDCLEGIRVVDLCDELAAFSSRILADLGAEVVRVEPPGGSSMRNLAPFARRDEPIESSLIHLYDNAGKKSVVIDRTLQSGRDSFDSLIVGADVLLETERMNHHRLQTINRALIHITVTPYGIDGPWAEYRGNDLTLGAAGGLAWFCGAPDDPPNQSGGRQAYRITSLAAASAAMIALHGRRGAGCHIDIAAQRAVASTTVQSGNMTLAEWFDYAQTRPAYGSALECADGKWTAIAQARLPRSAAFRSWAADEGFEVPEIASIPLPEIRERFASIALQLAARYERKTFLQKAWAAGVNGMPINDMNDIAEAQHFRETGAFVSVEHEWLGRPIQFPNSPVVALGVHHIARAPHLGEHQSLLETQDIRTVSKDTTHRELHTALNGVRVVDFCWMLAGPLGTRILANFGAEVIRVEAGRRAYPDTLPDGYDQTALGAFHNLVDAAKRSITIDPRTERGRELLLELIATADIVTENYRPGALAAMGLGFDKLEKVNPRLICLHMPGCGSTGPWSKLGTFGPQISSAAGIDALMGFPGSPPFGMGPAYPDFASPHFMAISLLAALRRRERTGSGMEIDLSQLAATFSLLGPEWMSFDLTGKVPTRNRNRDPNYCPHGIYPAKGDDEWIAIAAGPDQFEAFASAIGRPELSADDRFKDHGERKRNEDALDEAVVEWTQSRGRFEAAEYLQQLGFAVAAVETPFDVILGHDPQLASYYELVEQPVAPELSIRVAGETIRQVGVDKCLSPAPPMGSANAYVLHDILGYSERDIAAFSAEGILKDYRYFPERTD